MINKIFATFVLLILCNPLSLCQEAQIPYGNFERHPLDNMPVLERDKFGNTNPAPVPKRGLEYRRFLLPYLS